MLKIKSSIKTHLNYLESDFIMEYNEKSYGLGSKRSIIREIFEYSKTRANEIGADKVFDFSLGNPSVEPPKEVNDAIRELLSMDNQTLLHGYTSAQGDMLVRRAISDNINKRFDLNLTEERSSDLDYRHNLTITKQRVCNCIKIYVFCQ